MCPVCNSIEFKIIGIPFIDRKLEFLVKEDYKVVKCLSCEYCFVNPRLNFTADQWAKIYNQEYFGILTKWHYKKRRKDRIKRISRMEEFSVSEIQNFLDIGCGEGAVLLESVNRGWKTFGVDISDNRMDDAKIFKIEFKQGDIFKANYSDNFFDCIYLDSVLEHVINPKEYLSEVHRILKIGGVVYIGVPNEDSLQNFFKSVRNYFTGRKRYSSKIKPFVSPYHIGGFNKKSLIYGLREEKFKILKFRNFATRAVFLLEEFPSKGFLRSLALTIIFAVAFLLRKEYYIEIYAQK